MLETKCEVLVVDDDEAFLKFSSELLVEEGYNVSLAENGKVALSLIEKGHNPNAIIMDIRMPVMCGIEFAKRLRELNPDLLSRVLVVTALPDKDIKKISCFPELFVKKIEKPFDLDDFLDEVYSLAGRIKQ